MLAAICPNRGVDHIRLDRIGGDALDTAIIGIQIIVLQRNPALRRSIPAIDAAHVAAQIYEVALDRAEDDAGNITAATDLDTMPGVIGSRSVRRPSQNQQQRTEPWKGDS